MADVPNGNIYIPVWIAALAVLPNVLSSVLGFLNHMGIRRANRRALVTARKMDSLEANTNSKMDALLAVTAAAEHAKGVIEGKEQKD
jgi:hypothetical protein